ncbi:MAG: excinuclease ABC subunit UvrC, partial [Candidatus Adiutrix sp.]
MNRDAKIEVLRQKALNLPPQPGVYLMKDVNENVLYVGKAKNLPRRVVGYFQKTPPSPRISLMVARIDDFDFVVTATEKESLILENSFIKKYRPKFNVVLRDDKTYPSLRLSLNQPFPRLEIVRRPAHDGSIIFGPFPSSGALRDTLNMVQRLFPLRQCKRPDVKSIDRPCLNYQMGRCIAPCRPEVTPEEYGKLVKQVRLFFRGGQNEVLKQIETDMKVAAEVYDYEEAARLRDRLHNVRKTLERQLISQNNDSNWDALGLYSKDGAIEGALLLIRSGVVSGCMPLESSGEGADAKEAAFSLLSQYYSSGHFIPDEILLPFAALADGDVLAQWLSSLKGKPVKITTPRQGDRLRLLEMAQENAKVALENRLNRLGRTIGVMVEIKAKLNLEKVPNRLECFDLAHLQGQNAAAGLVVMEGGEWKKSQYRRFKIKQAKGGDDYGGMREVVARRFSHEDWPYPDLLLIDGGKGQLASALAAFDDLGLTAPPVAAIAKIRQDGDIDRIFLPGRKNPCDLKANSGALLL